MSPQVRNLSTTVALVAVAVAYILWQRPLDRGRQLSSYWTDHNVIGSPASNPA